MITIETLQALAADTRPKNKVTGFDGASVTFEDDDGAEHSWMLSRFLLDCADICRDGGR